jgi:subtilisin
MLRWIKLVLGVICLGLLCQAQATEFPRDNALIRRIVVFSPKTIPTERITIVEASGGKVVRELDLIDAVAIEAPAARIQGAEAKLKVHPEVLRIDEDPRLNWLMSTPANFSELPLPDTHAIIEPFRSSRLAPDEGQAPVGQEIPWGIKRVNAPAAWDITRGQGVKVAVIDTGIDYNHPDLKANIAGGWNAINKEKPNEFLDDNGHGSHVAGTIAAIDDDKGVVGIAPKVSLYGVKVLDADGSGTFDEVIAGMQWAVDNKMQVANMSLGAYVGNESLKAAVQAMANNGVVLVASAGNSGRSVGYPAAYPGALAIAASNSGDKVASFSSRGPEVAFIAPGVSVKSTYMGGGYDSFSGTSMAAPHVAGLSAFVISTKGLLGLEAVSKALKGAAAKLKDVPAEQQGAGIIDAAKLVQ